MSFPAGSTEISLPIEWDHDTEMLNDEEFSATSNEEASKVLEQWQADQDQDQGFEIMEVDEQIGSTFLGDEIFDEPCVSPTGPLEELVLMNINEDDDRFFAPVLDAEEPNVSQATSSLPFEERYQLTLQKLQESMKRSQETRKSLKMED